MMDVRDKYKPDLECRIQPDKRRVCSHCEHSRGMEPLMSYYGDTSDLESIGSIIIDGEQFKVMVTKQAHQDNKLAQEEFERLQNHYRENPSLRDSDNRKYKNMFSCPK